MANTYDKRHRLTTLEAAVIDVGTDLNITPTFLTDIMDINRNDSSIKRYDFEVFNGEDIENILNEYIVYLNNPDFLHRIKFTTAKALHCEMNMNLISYILYKDVNLAWSIPYLNDLIKHPSDLTRELLETEGVIAFNENGIDALRELINYKTVNEENANGKDKESLFTLNLL